VVMAKLKSDAGGRLALSRSRAKSGLPAAGLGSPGELLLAKRDLCANCHRTWQRIEARSAQDSEGGPESRLWAAIAGRGQDARTARPKKQCVADEVWHPEQEGKRLEDGGYELKIPYRDSRELVMDILRHGPDVVVIEPAELVEEVKGRPRESIERYK
jgi:WYL domain